MTAEVGRDGAPAREAIATLLAEYCHLCDDGAFDDLVERFTRDGTFVFGDRSVTGRDDLRTWFERTQSPERRGKHVTANVIITVEGDRATAVSDYVFLVVEDGRPTPLVAGRYHDELRIDGDRWRFVRRVATTM